MKRNKVHADNAAHRLFARDTPNAPASAVKPLATAVTLALVAFSQPTLAANCTWNPVTGNWATASDWSCAAVPGGADSATVGAAKTVTINAGQTILNLTNAGSVNIDAFLLTLNGGGSTTNTGTLNVGAGPIPNNAALNIGGGHNIDNTGGIINVRADSVINQFGSTISGGTINTTGTGKLVAFASGVNFLDNTTLNGTLDMASGNGIERITNGLVLNGTVNIAQASILAPQGNQTISGNGNIVFTDNNVYNRLNVEAGNLTLGSGITVRGNTGVIGNQSFVGGAATLINQGTIAADVSGGTITLDVNAGVTNTGTLRANNGGTLQLNQSGAGIANTGGMIRADNNGAVVFNGVTISGGTLDTSSGGRLVAAANGNNFINNTTLNGTLDLASANGIERITNGLVLNGTVNIAKASIFAPQGNQTISGTGSIVFADNDANNRLNVEAGNLTLGSGITVRGNTGVIGNQSFVGGAATLINNGTIQADTAGGTITLQINGGGGVTNNGTLAALNGGTLLLNSNVTGNSGSQILAGAGSTVIQNGVTLNGAINVNGAGTFRASANNNNFLDNATLNGTLDLASANGVERVANNLTLNGAVNIAKASIFAPQGNQTISGTGSIVFADNDANNRLNVEAGNLTLGSGITVRGNTGVIGNQSFVGGGGTLTNNGAIQADVSGGTIVLAVTGGVTNNGTLAARNGGTLRVDNMGGVGVINAGGTMVADVGSTILLNGATISGGALNGGGGFRAVASGANFLDNVTLNGTLDLASAFGIERVTGGMALNGTVNIGNASILAPQGNQTISGTGSIVFADGNGSNRLNLEAGNLTLGSGVTVRGNTGVIGQQNYVGGAATLTNQGSIVSDGGGTITVNPSGALTNDGLFRAQNGTLVVQRNVGGTGTLQVDGAGAMTLANGGNSQGALRMGAAGAALNLGTGNLVISSDYTNTGAGSGNSFNRRAGVTGTGQIQAGGDVSQVITGANVTNGSTSNATLTIGNVRVGANTFNYQIGNAGTNGPTLRGALQTAANGGNISDGRLSGAGVTASNYNAGGPGGNSGNQAVVFNAASAGVLAPLSGQVVNLRSNFENIADQKLNIVLAGGAAAYNTAVGSAGSPIAIANQRVNGTNSTAVGIANTAASGAYSEDLNASVGSVSGPVVGSGSVAGRLAGTNNTGTGNINVGVATGSAGFKTGTVTINYQTAGAVNGVSNGLGVASAGSQTVTVSGNVYQAAAGQLQGNTLNFGTLQVGQQVNQNLVVRNTATGPAGFVEDLNASFGASGNSQITGSGSLAGILAGQNSTGANGTMTVSVTGATAGALNSGIAVNYFSAGAVNGVSNGLGTLGVGSEQFSVNGTIQAVGNVINQANPQINNPTIMLAARRVGDAAATANVSITNAAGAPPQAALNASIATNGAPVTASGSFNLLNPGATNNASLSVGISTATAGNFTGGNAGSATVSLVSDASNVGNCAPNCQMNLASQTVSVQGKVYSVAQGSVQSAVDFGIVHVGDVASQGVSVQNSAPATALNDTLKATIGGTGGAFTNNGGTVSGLAAGGAANSSALLVGLNTATAGIFSGNAVVGLASQNPDMADLNLGNANVALSGQVNKYANAVFGKVSGAGTLSRSGNVFTLDFGNVLQGSGALSALLDVDNAVGGGPADLLDGMLSITDGNDFAAQLLLSAFQNIGADGSSGNALSFLFDTNALGLGSFQDSVDLGWFGHNASGYLDPTRHYTLLVHGNVYTNGGGTVPEPSAALLMLTALAGLAWRRRQGGRAC